MTCVTFTQPSGYFIVLHLLTYSHYFLWQWRRPAHDIKQPSSDSLCHFTAQLSTQSTFPRPYVYCVITLFLYFIVILAHITEF